jgi:hypothetical protein
MSNSSDLARQRLQEVRVDIAKFGADRKGVKLSSEEKAEQQRLMNVELDANIAVAITQRPNLPTMTPENRDHMMELCRRICRETDAKRLALWIDELNVLIRRKVEEVQGRGQF